MFIFRTDGSAVVGLGHIRRCLSLAAVMSEPPVFALRSADEPVLAMIRRAGYRCYVLRTDYIAEPDELSRLVPDARVLLDQSNRQTLENFEEFDRNVSELKRHFPLVAMIDGFGADQFEQRLTTLPDLVFTPYAGAKTGNGHSFVGPGYFILSPDYSAYLKRDIHVPPVASRLLITGGGADPGRVTLLSLSAVNRLQDSLQVRVVIGPAFAVGLKDEIEGMARASPHSVELVRSADSLAPHMAWCHLAIATTGLTKYELAALAVPSIQISPDLHHADVNTTFEREKTAVHLGIAATLDAARLASEIDTLMHDSTARSALADNGRRLVDGKGAKRVAQILESPASVIQRTC